MVLVHKAKGEKSEPGSKEAIPSQEKAGRKCWQNWLGASPGNAQIREITVHAIVATKEIQSNGAHGNPSKKTLNTRPI